MKQYSGEKNGTGYAFRREEQRKDSYNKSEKLIKEQ
jgi:hypothetical protein